MQIKDEAITRRNITEDLISFRIFNFFSTMIETEKTVSTGEIHVQKKCCAMVVSPLIPRTSCQCPYEGGNNL